MTHLRKIIIAIAVLIPTVAIAGTAISRACCSDDSCCPNCPHCPHAK